MKWTFTLTIVYSRYADKTDTHFPALVDAALLRNCDMSVAKVQLKSPMRSFQRSKLRGPIPPFRCNQVKVVTRGGCCQTNENSHQIAGAA